ncbi:4-(cytidine 5'-diphospho)-2-C-methyl-D-erythritol kinase [Candidatus Halocynthiibacter alkanivorans]|uniref:4-(cytidine 5'-diphospho)-2-C-methyl-D-erythritol kinase n=1 Tax=Candidatus Halocynthiibacter alkanivorans TaxID=2267619 RepID=UPI000DF17181|nr:4-(cytidine 5'-diphospho)-2-C-methyl-D-erythritol kinase [Candidatus Halocynthiibacter alkanivorans]
MAIETFAPAKVNLTLHVTGQRADGYHLLDSLVVFADFGDRVTARPADELSLTVAGPRAGGVPVDERNLMMKAARFFGAHAALSLDKRLPHAAGIGGGSSDAAATLRALARLTGAAVPPGVVTLGADVPVCVLATAARMRGIGEDVSLVTGVPALPVVLVNPGVEVPTPAIFAGLARKDNAAMPEVMPRFDSPANCAAWLAGQRNDLEPPALILAPVIGEVLRALRSGPARLARMSGSGATCFAIYDTVAQAQQAAALLSQRQPGWWVQVCILNGAAAGIS